MICFRSFIIRPVIAIVEEKRVASFFLFFV